MVELVCNESVLGKLGPAERLDGLEGCRPAGRRVAILLFSGEVGRAQPVMVLRLYLQASDHVLLRVEGHGARPPVLSDPLPARNAVAAEEGGQKHGCWRERPQAVRTWQRPPTSSLATTSEPPRTRTAARRAWGSQ